VTGSHVYTESGLYTVKLQIKDDDGNISESAFEFVVVYDASAGFVTGGGWIMSPPGACQFSACGHDTTGQASFGFVSRYKKGAKEPTGQTQFQFKAGNLNFHSDEYQWLVVAHHKAMYKGVGTINGGGNYGFLLSAIDAELTPSTDEDLFRIKIWDKDSADAVVYDNQVACWDNAEDADPCTKLGAGDIVIHAGKE
jgi:PKD repeat protein